MSNSIKIGDKTPFGEVVGFHRGSGDFERNIFRLDENGVTALVPEGAMLETIEAETVRRMHEGA